MAVDAARAKSLFLAASDLDDPAERTAYLDRECCSDAELRGRVEALLRANDAAPLPRAERREATSTPLPDRPVPTENHGDPTARVGSVVAGRYKLIEAIGEGGMGQVFMAQQTEPVRRAVAVKVIKAGMDSKAVLARFEAERQALAMMDHPNIAKVLDAGTTDGGRPYFVMELVKGLPITKFCDERKLTPRQRLELFVPVCQAIQHAHQKGVIHRDIKPSNVMIALYDDRPVPKVIDFGVAKATGETLTEETLMTGLGAVVGTVEYMSPEQASLNNLDIDTRSDVYSLGVLLYELLTGTTPVDLKRLGQGAFLEVLRIVREVGSPKPSRRVSTAENRASVAACRGTEPAKLSKLMKGELDWVVMKALEKDRARRYETANGLARDIQRYLADELVEARPPSTGYRLKKFVRRHLLELHLTGSVALLLLGGLSVVWWQNAQAAARRETNLQRRLEDERRSAVDHARLARNAEAVAVLLGQCEDALRSGDPSRAAVALEAARKRSDEGGAEEHAERLERLAADLTLLQELDAIDQFRWTWVGNRFSNPAVAATRTREALRRFGVDPHAVSVEDAAARVIASTVRERIVTALDRRLLQERTAGVREVLRRVDADSYRDAVRDAILADDRAKFVELADETAALEQPPGFAVFLGECGAIDIERRRELLQAAVIRQSAHVSLLMTLGSCYSNSERKWAAERMRWFQAAIAADPANLAALNDLGGVLNERGQSDEAIACFRKAIELDPIFANAHNNLGLALQAKGRLDEAIDCYRKAIALDPSSSAALNSLGRVLDEKGQSDEAIDCYRKAIALEPNTAGPHNNLGALLAERGQVREAIACFEKAVELDPKIFDFRANLGGALEAAGRLDEAVASYRKAIQLGPENIVIYLHLGAILCDRMKDFDGAIACFEKAVELDPKSANARSNLASALFGKGLLDEAIASCRKAIELDPKSAHARYGLACGLALSAAGQGEHAGKRDPEERARLRRQASDALHEAVALYTEQLKTGKPADRAAANRTLRYLQQDPDLASLRDAAALSKLPSEEQKALSELWADVAALLKKAETPTPNDEPSHDDRD